MHKNSGARGLRVIPTNKELQVLKEMTVGKLVEAETYHQASEMIDKWLTSETGVLHTLLNVPYEDLPLEINPRYQDGALDHSIWRATIVRWRFKIGK